MLLFCLCLRSGKALKVSQGMALQADFLVSTELVHGFCFL